MMKKPLNQGPLKGNEQTILDKWLKNKNCHCPSCKSDQWGEANLGQIRFESGSGPFHPQGQPAVLLPCKNCGYIAFFCPFTIGIEQPMPEDSQ
jgi:predicted nucleic-acid-binding Zn-ribbon protein